MSTLEWQPDVHSLASGPMDDAHREFLTLTNILAASDDEDEIRSLQQLLVHCEAHFAQEQFWMQESGIAGAENHQRDHEGVLSLLQSALSDLKRGQHGAGRELADSLGDWFQQHSATMDAALAFQMQQASRNPQEAGIPSIG